MKFGIGQSVTRKEDARFLTGSGAYVEDIIDQRALHAFVVRSPVAHGVLNAVETDAASGADGVVAVLTGADCQSDNVGGISCHTLIPGLHKEVATREFPVLSTGKLLYVGMPVAVVIADSKMAARDAAELVELDYEELPAVVSTKNATAGDAPELWPDAPGNVAFEISLGDADATGRAVSAASHVTTLELHNNRLSANSLEMRGTMASYDQRDGRVTVYTSTQAPHSIRNDIASAIGLTQNDVHVVARDVGGGFGMKGGVYPEDIAVAWAAKKLKATVKWHPDRSEALVSDFHGRDQSVEASLALDASGRIKALKVSCDYNAGAFLSPGGGVSPLFAATLATGCYRVPVAHAFSRAVYTNTSPTQPYRGAGRPEASFLIERLLDKAARETGRDRIELRRLNMLTSEDMPYQTPLVYTIDSGDYPAVLDRAMEAADWSGFEARKAQSADNGKFRGIGIALHMENAGLMNESMEIRFDSGGGVTVLAGTFSHGQGHETVYSQMVSQWLGVPFESIRIVQGDTDAVSFGRGTVASRSMINGGGSLKMAADQVIEKARAIAGHLMEASAADIVFEDGALTVAGTDRTMTIQKVAAMSFAPILPPELGLGLSGSGDFKLEGFTFPNGCQVAEVEIDPETGVTTIAGIVTVDDVGTVINPMLLEGQLVGGIAQGLGQALMENFVYDESGQVVTGSFMDYAMPRASDMPPIHFEALNTATETNPLGAKGAGESGTVGATPVLISAILDALHHLGVDDIALPATPAQVWSAINTA
ncbi:xanthine dehydrogenase family protein molybdopterin-binding subunit [Hoeflea sp. WL0058]|uniref:Xanthine dehydrogenase family protein molybdopterin-binding subunit n=1 Tax=Flavimaribacter sediminis TaxID=2865987 RepID=A0AAE3CZK5_9HYPH|nr:xanthine dehydrogenase family protein molybdopterin-binding subunit [Flavimaribacter sediminis]MBW8636052.1 xanthine dehydrogenase family protein molybdopterin-binding subunit [Flavimaribacter sediminis]